MITRETDYAIRAMLCLALHEEGSVVSTTAVADAMDIPYRFLRRILLELTGAGLIVSLRGKQGGLRLAKAPTVISLLDIIQAVAPETIALNICLIDRKNCSRSSFCVVHEELGQIQTHINRELAHVTLATLAARERLRTGHTIDSQTPGASATVSASPCKGVPMSSDLKFQRCPETGICSIFQADAEKIDLMPDEVEALKEAQGDASAIKAVIAECDSNFAAKLSDDDVARIAQRFA